MTWQRSSRSLFANQFWTHSGLDYDCEFLIWWNFLNRVLLLILRFKRYIRKRQNLHGNSEIKLSEHATPHFITHAGSGRRTWRDVVDWDLWDCHLLGLLEHIFLLFFFIEWEIFFFTAKREKFMQLTFSRKAILPFWSSCNSLLYFVRMSIAICAGSALGSDLSTGSNLAVK